MGLIATSDELQKIIDENRDSIKEDFFTIRLFADAALRDALRRRGVKVPPDEVVAHIEKLKKTRRYRHKQQSMLRKKKSHKVRAKRVERGIDEVTAKKGG